jgi:hypothetical protein
VASDLEYESVMLVFLQEVMRSDLLSTQFPLNAPASSYPTVDEKFDVISYAKGFDFVMIIVFLIHNDYLTQELQFSVWPEVLLVKRLSSQLFVDI